MKNGSLKHEYDFYIYYATGHSKWSKTGDFEVNQKELDNHVYALEIAGEESVYRTFEKTMAAFEHVKGYDVYVRINISAYLNIKLFDSVIAFLDKKKIYCNAINTILAPESDYNAVIYARGDAMIMHSIYKEQIAEYGKRLLFCDEWLKNRINVVHVDDVLMGAVFYDIYKEDSYDMYTMLNYNMFFRSPDEITDKTFNSLCVFSRLKTIPPDEKTSGYSWDDNEYRRWDCKKMHKIHDCLKDVDYSKEKNFPILVSKDKARPTFVCNVREINPYKLGEIIRQTKR